MAEERPKPGGYRDLLVWQKGIQLAKAIYILTKSFPAEERYALTSQLRRPAISVPSNIAEGQARHTTGEFIQFIGYAEGSLAEIDTQLVIASEVGITMSGATDQIAEQVQELRRMLNALRRKLDA